MNTSQNSFDKGKLRLFVGAVSKAAKDAEQGRRPRRRGKETKHAAKQGRTIEQRIEHTPEAGKEVQELRKKVASLERELFAYQQTHGTSAFNNRRRIEELSSAVRNVQKRVSSEKELPKTHHDAEKEQPKMDTKTGTQDITEIIPSQPVPKPEKKQSLPELKANLGTFERHYNDIIKTGKYSLEEMDRIREKIDRLNAMVIAKEQKKEGSARPEKPAKVQAHPPGMPWLAAPMPAEHDIAEPHEKEPEQEMGFEVRAGDIPPKPPVFDEISHPAEVSHPLHPEKPGISPEHAKWLTRSKSRTSYERGIPRLKPPGPIPAMDEKREKLGPMPALKPEDYDIPLKPSKEKKSIFGFLKRKNDG